MALPRQNEPALKKSKTPPAEMLKLEAGGEAMDIKPGRIISPGERAILTSLQDRREKLDARERRLDMSEMLLKAAEKRLRVLCLCTKAWMRRMPRVFSIDCAAGRTGARGRASAAPQELHHRAEAAAEHPGQGGQAADLHPVRLCRARRY
jgi:hypothetical protein